MLYQTNHSEQVLEPRTSQPSVAVIETHQEEDLKRQESGQLEQVIRPRESHQSEQAIEPRQSQASEAVIERRESHHSEKNEKSLE